MDIFTSFLSSIYLLMKIMKDINMEKNDFFIKLLAKQSIETQTAELVI